MYAPQYNHQLQGIQEDETEVYDENDQQEYGEEAYYQNAQNQYASSTGGGNDQKKDFGKAYKTLVQQMLYQSQQTGGNVLVPTEDYTLAMERERKVDLNRVQKDIEKRKLNQEMREREARLEREAKEIEGCTFAPQIFTKKRRTTKKQNPPATVSLSISGNAAGSTEEETQREEGSRELTKFLNDQKRFEDRKKLN